MRSWNVLRTSFNGSLIGLYFNNAYLLITFNLLGVSCILNLMTDKLLVDEI